MVNYHSKFPVIKQVEGFSTDNLMKMCKMVFSEYGLPSKIVSDLGTNFLSEKLEDFSRCLSIHHLIISSYNCESNGHAEAFIIFIKRMIKMLGDLY